MSQSSSARCRADYACAKEYGTLPNNDPANFESTRDWLNRVVGKEKPISIQDTPPAHLDMLKKGIQVHRDVADIITLRIRISIAKEKAKCEAEEQKNQCINSAQTGQIQRLTHILYSEVAYFHISCLCEELDRYSQHSRDYWRSEFASWEYDDFPPRLLKYYVKSMESFRLTSPTYKYAVQVYELFRDWREEKQKKIEEQVRITNSAILLSMKKTQKIQQTHQTQQM